MSSLEYFIKANLILLVWAILYRIFLRSFSGFSFSRFFLLSAAPCALLFPWLNVPVPGILNSTATTVYLKTVEIVATNKSVENSIMVMPGYVWLLVLPGFLLLSPRYIISLIKLARLRKKASMVVSEKGLKIYHIAGDFTPFSFHRSVYIPCCDLPGAVLLHEKAHIKYRHTYDLVLLSIFKFVFWINPSVWYISRELRSIHEYQADAAVLDSGEDKVSYFQLLLGLSLRNFPGFPVNSFNQSLTKKRIIMMKKINSGQTGLLKALSAIVILFISVYFISCGGGATKDAGKTNKDSINKETAKTEAVDKTSGAQVDKEAGGEVYTIVEKMPQFGSKEADLSLYLSKNIKYPLSAREKGIEGTVFISFVVEPDGKVMNAKILRSASPELDKEALRVVQSMPAWNPGTQKGKPVAVSMNLPIKFKLS